MNAAITGRGIRPEINFVGFILLVCIGCYLSGVSQLVTVGLFAYTYPYELIRSVLNSFGEIRNKLLPFQPMKFDTYVCSLVLPGLLVMIMMMMTSPNTMTVDDYSTRTMKILLVGMVAWFPYESFIKIFVDFGRVRECLADVIPLIGPVLPFVPQLIVPIVVKLPAIIPVIGDLAEYLKYLLKYPVFISKALPPLLTKIELMGPVIPMIGPKFKEMDARHYAKLELVIESLVNDIEELLPYFHVIAPHIVEISLRADRLFPIVHYVIPHAETMQQHISWLIPFADIDDFESFMPYIDRLVPHVEVMAPFGPQLLPFIPRIKKHVPILMENVETMLPILGDAIDYLDPVVYWLSDMMPLAHSLGILRSTALLNAGLPFAQFLPKVPSANKSTDSTTTYDLQEIFYNGNELIAIDSIWKLKGSQVLVTIDPITNEDVSGKKPVYYVWRLNGVYGGEFRYSHLLKLHETIVKPLKLPKVPEFPGKIFFNNKNQGMLENRRVSLEKYLTYVFNQPLVVGTREFLEFVKKYRKFNIDKRN